MPSVVPSSTKTPAGKTPAVDRLALNIAPDDAAGDHQCRVQRAGLRVDRSRSIHAVDASRGRMPFWELKLSGIAVSITMISSPRLAAVYHPLASARSISMRCVHIFRRSRAGFGTSVWTGSAARVAAQYHGLSGIVARLFSPLPCARPRLAASISDLFETGRWTTNGMSLRCRVQPLMWTGIELDPVAPDYACGCVPHPQRRQVMDQHQRCGGIHP